MNKEIIMAMDAILEQFNTHTRNKKNINDDEIIFINNVMNTITNLPKSLLNLDDNAKVCIVCVDENKQLYSYYPMTIINGAPNLALELDNNIKKPLNVIEFIVNALNLVESSGELPLTENCSNCDAQKQNIIITDNDMDNIHTIGQLRELIKDFKDDDIVHLEIYDEEDNFVDLESPTSDIIEHHNYKGEIIRKELRLCKSSKIKYPEMDEPNNNAVNIQYGHLYKDNVVFENNNMSVISPNKKSLIIDFNGGKLLLELKKKKNIVSIIDDKNKLIHQSNVKRK